MEWNVSTTTMQAYLYMKGPGTDMEDGLMAWISEQEDEDSEDRDPGSGIVNKVANTRLTIVTVCSTASTTP